MTFQWWFIPVALVLLLIFVMSFTGKGGVVSKEYKAKLDFLGERKVGLSLPTRILKRCLAPERCRIVGFLPVLVLIFLEFS